MKSLNKKQKATHMGIGLEHLMWYERQGDEFLDGTVSGYESWCLHYDPETKLHESALETSIISLTEKESCHTHCW
jgi:hypothetical protein